MSSSLQSHNKEKPSQPSSSPLWHQKACNGRHQPTNHEQQHSAKHIYFSAPLQSSYVGNLLEISIIWSKRKGLNQTTARRPLGDDSWYDPKLMWKTLVSGKNFMEQLRSSHESSARQCWASSVSFEALRFMWTSKEVRRVSTLPTFMMDSELSSSLYPINLFSCSQSSWLKNCSSSSLNDWLFLDKCAH